MRLLITGASGYIGSALLNRASPRWLVAGTFLTHSPTKAHAALISLDVRDSPAVQEGLHSFQPDVIIHTAALMRGDSMQQVNVDGSRNIAAAATRVGARLIHLSSDVIFDGEHAPYAETGLPSPITPYANSKASAELAVIQAHPDAMIVRTSLVYGFNPLDPRTRQVLEGSMPHLFTDEYRCPIFVDDLADALLGLTESDRTGVLNIAGPQSLSRYEFGTKLASAFHIKPLFSPALCSSSPQPRPRNCTLDISLARRLLTTQLRSVDQVLSSLSTY